MNNRTATLYARIDPEIKAQAESILSDLNMTASGAINLFYKQIVLHRGLPFEVKMPKHKLMNIDEATDEEITEAVLKGLEEIEQGRCYPAEQVFAMLDKKHNLYKC